MKFTFLTEKGEIQPVEGLLGFLVLFCIARGIDCALIASNHFEIPTDVLAGELTFEWGWPMGFSAMVFYTGGLVRMLVKIKYDSWFYKVLRRPHMINAICFSYCAASLSFRWPSPRGTARRTTGCRRTTGRTSTRTSTAPWCATWCGSATA
eukprot:Opistho-1_new@88383